MKAAPSSRRAGDFLRRRSACRACGSGSVERFLRLGPTPLANAFPESPAAFADERWYPLDVYFCDECSLVQLLDVVDPEVLFSHYLYVSGTSDTIARHNRRLAERLTDVAGLAGDDLVVEIGSNDGSLLRCFQDLGVGTLGVEPARNLAERAEGLGIETENLFFDEEVAADLLERRGPASAMVANNVLAHVDDTPGFLRGIRTLLAEDGTAVVEVPYLRELVDRLEYDTIYHEHLCYFSVEALRRLAEGAGLRIGRLERIPVHGGSLRLYLRHEEVGGHAPAVEEAVEAERVAGLHGVDRYREFAEAVRENRRALRELLGTLVEEGHEVAAYGAAAKGNTLAAYCDLEPELVRYVVDKNPLKVGTFTPGTHLPVRPVEVLERERPDFLLLLAWNFADEIRAQQRAFREAGGRFIVPVPEPEILD